MALDRKEMLKRIKEQLEKELESERVIGDGFTGKITIGFNISDGHIAGEVEITKRRRPTLT